MSETQCDWSELVMSVAGKPMAGSMQKLTAQHSASHTYTYTHIMHTHSQPHTNASVDMRERRWSRSRREQKCRAHAEAVRIPDGELSKQEQVFKFTEAILL